jgi:hypothetical protein
VTRTVDEVKLWVKTVPARWQLDWDSEVPSARVKIWRKLLTDAVKGTPALWQRKQLARNRGFFAHLYLVTGVTHEPEIGLKR